MAACRYLGTYSDLYGGASLRELTADLTIDLSQYVRSSPFSVIGMFSSDLVYTCSPEIIMNTLSKECCLLFFVQNFSESLNLVILCIHNFFNEVFLFISKFIINLDCLTYQFCV